MIVDDAGLAFLIKWEWFIPYLYDDPFNATVGVGLLVHEGLYHRARGVCNACDAWPRKWETDQWLTVEQGMTLLRITSQSYADYVDEGTPGLTPNKRNAMIDFAYNTGKYGYANSDVAQAVRNGGDLNSALQHHVIAGGQVLNILQLRRADEFRLFNSPKIYGARMYTDADIDLKIQAVLALGVRNQSNLSDLANGQEAVINRILNGAVPKLSLKGLWYVSGKEWPYGN